MKHFSPILAVVLASFFTCSVAHADIPFPGGGAALEARDSLVRDLAEGHPNRAADYALDQAVRLGLGALESEGRFELAARYRKEWENRFTDALTRLSALGDHRPLSQFLARFADLLIQVLGKDSKYGGVISDIRVMNYAIPVVFSPKGDWRSGNAKKDRPEYGLHFVPFSGIVTFYAANFACRQIAKKRGMDTAGQKLCPKLAGLLEKEMRTKLAPKLSDSVFNRANHLDTRLDLSERDFIYRDARELESAL